jgi:hypothetical protein
MLPWARYGSRCNINSAASINSAAGYVLDEPAVPYRQISQAYWGESTYTVKQRLGLNLRLTYNSARSGFRPDLNPNTKMKASGWKGLVTGNAQAACGFSFSASKRWASWFLRRSGSRVSIPKRCRRMVPCTQSLC